MQSIQAGKASGRDGTSEEQQDQNEFLNRARKILATRENGAVIYDRGNCKVLLFEQENLVVKIVNEAELRRTESAFLMLSAHGYSPPRSLLISATTGNEALLIMERIPREQISLARTLYFNDDTKEQMKRLVTEGMKIMNEAGFHSDSWIPDHGSNVAVSSDAEVAARNGLLERKHLIPFDPVG
jgi:hypothetical protein